MPESLIGTRRAAVSICVLAFVLSYGATIATAQTSQVPEVEASPTMTIPPLEESQAPTANPNGSSAPIDPTTAASGTDGTIPRPTTVTPTNELKPSAEKAQSTPPEAATPQAGTEPVQVSNDTASQTELPKVTVVGDVPRAQNKGKKKNRKKAQAAAAKARKLAKNAPGPQAPKSTSNSSAPSSGGTDQAGDSPVDLAGDSEAPEEPTDQSYSVSTTSTATKTKTPLMEIPVTVEVIPKKILEEQSSGSSGLADALAYTGVLSNGWSTQGETMTFRGFTTSTTLWNGFRIEELTPSYVGSQGGVWMDNVDRIEVLKGPSSVLYGRAEPGGAVNILTEKPLSESSSEVDVGTGSFDLHRIGADLTGALSANKTLLFRLNAAEESAASWYLKGPKYESQGVAPALQWRPRPDTTLSYEGQYRHLEGIAGQPYMPIDPSTGQAEPVDPRITLMPGNEATFDQYRNYLALDHKFDTDWSLSLKYMHNAVKSPYNGGVFVWGFGYPIENDKLPANLMVGFNNTHTSTNAAMVDLTGRFAAFGATHNILVGADYYNTQVKQTSGWDFNQTTDYFNPDVPLIPPATDFWDKDSTEYAIYMQDHIQLPWNWHLLLGGRHQSLDDHSTSYAPSLFLPYEDVLYENKVFLPQFGVLWRAQPWLSPYYSYSESMGATTGIDFTGTPIDPEFGKQHEAGIKLELLDGRLSATGAVFDLTKFNVASADPAHPGFNIGVGEVESEGFELSLQGALTQSWNVLASYSQARPLVLVGTDAGSIYTGPTIVAGQFLPYVSNETFSLWTSYQMPEGTLAGLTVGGGYIWASAPNPQDGATIPTKDYQTVSAFAAYETKLFGNKATLRLNVDNLFDERYLLYQGDDVVFGGNVLGGNWGAPREVKLNLRMEF